jgi:hypothetical protein
VEGGGGSGHVGLSAGRGGGECKLEMSEASKGVAVGDDKCVKRR